VLKQEQCTVQTGWRILVVDDNAVNLLVMGRFLEDLTIAYDAVDSAEKCLDALSRRDYDLVFMDKHMPGTNGIEALQKIRQRKDAAANIPVIACTADAMSGERENLLEQGFDDFLATPVRTDDISKVLAEKPGGHAEQSVA